MAGKLAAEQGVTLVFQNHHDIALHCDARYWLLKEVNLPNVLAGWNAWSLSLKGLTSEQLHESILKIKPFIVITIAANYVAHPRYSYGNNHTNCKAEQPIMPAVPMGQGIIDFKTWFSTLKEIGYQGWVVYEMCEVLDGGGSIENLDKTARIFLDYMKQF